jgi:hypothetical protein
MPAVYCSATSARTCRQTGLYHRPMRPRATVSTGTVSVGPDHRLMSIDNKL